MFFFQSCKYALRLLGPLIGSDDINNMFQNFLLDNAHLHYGEFMNDLSKVIVSIGAGISMSMSCSMNHFFHKFEMVSLKTSLLSSNFC
jgi:hypothetical protein